MRTLFKVIGLVLQLVALYYTLKGNYYAGCNVLWISILCTSISGLIKEND